MAIVDIKNYRALQTRRINNMRRRKKLTENETAQYMASLARRMVPRRSGKLSASIRVTKNRVRAGARGNEGFPYIHWVNQTKGAGMRTLRVQTPSGKVNIEGRWVRVPGRIMVYGSRPAQWTWTGTPGFFTKALMDTRKRFPYDVRRKVTHAAFTATVA